MLSSALMRLKLRSDVLRSASEQAGFSPIPDKVGCDQASDEGNLDDARSDRLSDAAAAEEEPDIDGDEEQATNSAIVTAVLAAI